MNIVFYNINWAHKNTERCFVGSIRKHMPNAHIIQLSDMETPKVDDVDEVIKERRLFARSKNNVHYEGYRLLSELDVDELMFADMDFIFNDSVEHLFDGDFEVSLCDKRGPGCGIRTHQIERYPYLGVIITKTKEFWKDCYKYMLGFEKKRWPDNMEAVAKIVDSGKYKVKFIDGNIYNKVPRFKDDYNPDAKIYHFKGSKKVDRKEWMEDFYDEYIMGEQLDAA